MRTKSLLIGLIFICLANFSCERLPVSQTFELSDQTKNFMRIKEGSYYVYKDSATNSVDSFYYPRQIGPGSFFVVREFHTGILTSHYFESLDDRRLYMIARAYDTNSEQFTFSTLGKNWGIYQKNLEVGGSFQDESFFNGTSKLVQLHSSINIQGNQYTDVYECHATIDSCQDCNLIFDCKSWFNLTDGLIKFSIEKPGYSVSKELVRYQRIN